MKNSGKNEDSSCSKSEKRNSLRLDDFFSNNKLSDFMC